MAGDPLTSTHREYRDCCEPSVTVKIISYRPAIVNKAEACSMEETFPLPSDHDHRAVDEKPVLELVKSMRRGAQPVQLLAEKLAFSCDQAGSWQMKKSAVIAHRKK